MSYQLIPLNGDPALVIDTAEVVVGRSRFDCDVVVKGAHISKRHARLSWIDGALTVIDLGSSNGTWVNGARIQSASVNSGDELAFGSSRFRVELTALVMQPAIAPADVEQDASGFDQSATIVSLELLDQYLERASDCTGVPSPSRLSPAKIHSDQHPSKSASQLTATVADADLTTRELSLVSLEMDVGPRLLAEFELTKATRLAAKTVPAELGIKQTNQAPPGPVEVPTSINLSDDSDPPAEIAASTSTAINETTTTAPDRSLWTPSSKPPQKFHQTKEWSSRRTVESSGWRQLPKHSIWITSAIAGVVLVLVAGLYLFGNHDGSTIELCERLHKELIDRRKQQKTNDPDWAALCQQNLAELKAIAKSLEQTVDSSQPERQQLLYAVRYELPVMLAPGPHWESKLTPEAKKLEELFDIHLKIARGQLSLRDVVKSTNGSAPSERSDN